MIKRLLYTALFVGLHMVFYVFFRSFLHGSGLYLAVYGCTALSFAALCYIYKRGGYHG